MKEEERKPLTTQEKLFVDNYLSNGFNGTKAATSAKYAHKNAANMASLLLKRPEVQEEIEKFLEKSRADNEGLRQIVLDLWQSVATVTIDMYIEKIYKQGKKAGTIEWKDISNWSPAMKKACSGIKYDRYGIISIELNGKQWASDSICKYLGLYKTDDGDKGKTNNGVVIMLPDNGRRVYDAKSEEVIINS